MPVPTSPLPQQSLGHGLLHGGSVALAIVTQVCAAVFFALAQENRVPNAVFETSFGNVSETWNLEVTMAHWAQNNWPMVDCWALVSLVEAVYRLWKRNVFGPESCNPELHSPLFYLMWASVNSARICSMLTWDRHDIVAAFLFSIIQPTIGFYMLYTSYYNLNKYKRWLTINNRNVIWWTRYLVQSGLALSAWWSLQIAAVNFGVVLKYKAGVQDPLSSTLVLTTLLLTTITWFILQTMLYLKYMRHTFTVYPILILGLGAMFTTCFQVSNVTANTLYCGLLMILITIMCTIHFIAACLYRDFPPSPDTVQHDLTLENCAVVCQPEAKGNRQTWP
ncbi:hypothetical protein NL108_012923 [Boleophthalmus pectinirostris]|nr:hypothetical protein NL108_012923 [Boleophthalmus pectinirostris]